MEMCDDIASEPVMEKAVAEIPREATHIVVEDMVKRSIEVGADSAKKPTLVGIADVGRVLETAELGVAAASEPVMVMGADVERVVLTPESCEDAASKPVMVLVEATQTAAAKMAAPNFQYTEVTTVKNAVEP